MIVLRHRSGDEDMKRALLKYGPYAGVQQQTRFDDNGDTPRKVGFEVKGVEVPDLDVQILAAVTAALREEGIEPVQVE